MVLVNQSEHILYLAFDCNLFTWLETFLLIWILLLINCRKKWLPQQLRKLSHSKTDKLPVDKSILKKGSEKKIKVSTDEVSWWKIYYKKCYLILGKAERRKRSSIFITTTRWCLISTHQFPATTRSRSWGCTRVPWAATAYETTSRQSLTTTIPKFWLNWGETFNSICYKFIQQQATKWRKCRCRFCRNWTNCKRENGKILLEY